MSDKPPLINASDTEPTMFQQLLAKMKPLEMTNMAPQVDRLLVASNFFDTLPPSPFDLPLLPGETVTHTPTGYAVSKDDQIIAPVADGDIERVILGMRDSFFPSPVPPFPDGYMPGVTYGADMIGKPTWPGRGYRHYRCKRHSAPKKRKRRLRKKIESQGYYVYHDGALLMRFPWFLTDEEYEIVNQGMINLIRERKIHV